MQNYVYFEQKISPKNDIKNETNKRIRNEWSVFGKNNTMLKSKMPLYSKRKVFNYCVLHALTCGTETSTLTGQMVQRLQTTQCSIENVC